MSRHNITLPSSTMPSTQADVVVGFDSARNSFFCHAVSQWGGILFSSGLDPAHPAAQNVDELVKPLGVVGITLPQSILDNLRRDQVTGAGDVSYYYEPDGTPTDTPVGLDASSNKERS